MSTIENVRTSVQASVGEMEGIVSAGIELHELQEESVASSQNAYDSIDLVKGHISKLTSNVIDALSNGDWAHKRTENLHGELSGTIVADTNLEGHKESLDFIADCFRAATQSRNSAIKNTFDAQKEIETASGGLAKALSSNTRLGDRIDSATTGLRASAERAGEHATVVANNDTRHSDGLLNSIRLSGEDLTLLSDTVYDATNRISSPNLFPDIAARLQEVMTLLDESTRMNTEDFINCFRELRGKITSDDIDALNVLSREVKEGTDMMQYRFDSQRIRLKEHADHAVQYGKVLLDHQL